VRRIHFKLDILQIVIVFLTLRIETNILYVSRIGKQTGVPRAEHGLGYSVVSELSSNHRNKHHHIVLDNAFTSPVLCHDLYRHDIYVTGTVLREYWQ
jgi:hypothetical protein